MVASTKALIFIKTKVPHQLHNCNILAIFSKSKHNIPVNISQYHESMFVSDFEMETVNKFEY